MKFFITYIESIFSSSKIYTTERERLPTPSSERTYDRSYPPQADRYADTRETYPPRPAAYEDPYKHKPAGTELFKSIAFATLTLHIITIVVTNQN